MAECHPVGFQWVMEAKARGATVIHVDPRFTRTSAVADVYVPIRAGADIAFVGGLINYVLQNDKYFHEYVTAYTNAATILTQEFADTEDLDGLFSGLNAEDRYYDFDTWRYEGDEVKPASGDRQEPEPRHEEAAAGAEAGAEAAAGADGRRRAGGRHEADARHRAEARLHAVRKNLRRAGRGEAHGSGGAAANPRAHRDETLQHPRCVFQVLKRHFARYTPELVEQVSGVTAEQFETVCRLVTENSGKDRTTAFVYSLGWTQHTVGVQFIRTAAILQALLGNIGRPGGGILALRGHASIQGSTDIPTLFDLLPGYLPMPYADGNESLDAYVRAESVQNGFWSHTRDYLVSMLKAWWGDAATADNEFCYDYLPRLTGSHSTYDTVVAQLDGICKGYFLFGQNPAVGSANARMQRGGMANLDWLVVRDLFMIESATWWKDGPEIETGEMRTEDIGTEVFFLPVAAHTEKSGSFTNTQRLLQWHHQAVEPAGDARSDLQFTYDLGRRIRAKLAASDSEMDRPVLDLTWDYPTMGKYGEPDADAVLAEINGTGPDGQPLSAYTQLKSDGSTSCGCWIYCGVRAGGVNQAARRTPWPQQTWVAPEWGWAWPANRRVLYNRASADPDGRPWSDRKALVWWDAEQGKWTGPDVPDFVADRPPSYRPPEGATGVAAISGTDPFIMQADGKAWLFAPAGLVDGPMPAHYEPQESPFRNVVYGQQHNPVRHIITGPEDRFQPSGDEPGSAVFPYVTTTYRLTEHHTAGGMSRFLPYLSELQPAFFCEVSPELAAERSLEHLGWATIVTARAAIEARVLVTERMRPLTVQGRTLHQVGLPWHWGPNGYTSGDAANELAHLALDPNVHIQEVKAMACDIRAGRRPRGPALRELVRTYQQRAGITDETGTEM
jgi:formate dehydrogenase major subunit